VDVALSRYFFLAGSLPFFEVEGPVFLPLAVLVSSFYLALAARFWFRTPIIGCGLSLLFFCLSWVLKLLGH
jgi:hypothetical protein